MEMILFTTVFLAVLSLFYAMASSGEAYLNKKKKQKLEVRFGFSRQAKLDELKSFFKKDRGSPAAAGSPLLKNFNYLLISAGIPLSPGRFVFICLVGAAVLFMIVFALLHHFWVASAGAALSLVLPFIFLVVKKQKIQKALIGQMPDALGMVVRSITVGQSVDAALKDIADSMPAPLSTEIRIIYEEIRMGLSFEQAIGNFDGRYPGLADIKIFCTAFIIQRETGGSLAQILTGLSDTIKKRFHFQRQIKTFSAEARTSAMVIGLLPLLFVLITYLFNPEYITRLSDNPTGRTIIFAATALEVLGFIIMRRMARIKI